MSWEPELEELRRREELARRIGGEERVERQHASGRLTVRERIERLFDEGTFHETGALAGRGTYGEDGELTEFLPANTIVGQGRIDGRRAVVQGDDFTVRGVPPMPRLEKAVYAERLAQTCAFVSGSWTAPRRGSVKTLEQGLSYVPPLPGSIACEEPVDRYRGSRGARTVRASRGARGLIAFLGDRKGTAQLVRAAHRGRHAGMAIHDKEEMGGARLQAAPAAVETWPPTRRTPRAAKAFSPTCGHVERRHSRRQRPADAARSRHLRRPA